MVAKMAIPASVQISEQAETPQKSCDSRRSEYPENKYPDKHKLSRSSAKVAKVMTSARDGCYTEAFMTATFQDAVTSFSADSCAFRKQFAAAIYEAQAVTKGTETRGFLLAAIYEAQAVTTFHQKVVTRNVAKRLQNALSENTSLF